MLRFINVCLALGLVALAYVIYEVKYESRALDDDIALLQKDIEAERDAVAVLRAEWSLLNRPERIERLAEKYLKLAPANPNQLVTLETLKDSDFDGAAAVAAAAPKSAPAKTAAPKTAAARPPAAQAAVGEAAPARPKAKPPMLATSVLPPVTVFPPGE
jgi:cell division protein FtsL